jgi:3-keto-disaccharide hydrolase
MRKLFTGVLVFAALAACIALWSPAGSGILSAQEAIFKWVQHDRDRPVPAVVTPGTPSTQEQTGKAPSDATMLFNGHDLSNWESIKGGPAPWKVENDYFEVAPGTGDIRTKDSFGDCQLHVEWATPNPPHGEDQDRGNSGVFLNGLFEMQVLDSYNSRTYADGQASAVYGQYPPLVNATLPPGQWQTYDFVWHGPKFWPNGNVESPATVTTFLNGVVVQDHVTLSGPTGHHVRPAYKPGMEKGPLELQDHNHPVRYRNIWIRQIPESQ